MGIKFAYMEATEDHNIGIPIFREHFKKAVEEMKMLDYLSGKGLLTKEAETYMEELCTYVFININSYLEHRHREFIYVAVNAQFQSLLNHCQQNKNLSRFHHIMNI